jgi:hypothetical protein
MASYNDVARLADALTPLEKAQLIAYLAYSLQPRLTESAQHEEDWHTFIERTAGSLADSPIQRWDDEPVAEREPIE